MNYSPSKFYHLAFPRFCEIVKCENTGVVQAEWLCSAETAESGEEEQKLPLILAQMRRCFFLCGQNCADSSIRHPRLQIERWRWRKAPDFAVRNCTEKKPLNSQGTVRSLPLPQGIDWLSEMGFLVNARKEGLISESGITTAMKRPFAERFKLSMFDPHIQHNPFFDCSIGGAQCACT
jgi:hypothetical protein